MTSHSPTLFLASGEVLLALQKFLLRATTLGHLCSRRFNFFPLSSPPAAAPNLFADKIETCRNDARSALAYPPSSSVFPVSTLNCLFHLHSSKRHWGLGRPSSSSPVKQSLRQFDDGSDSPIAHPSLNWPCSRLPTRHATAILSEIIPHTPKAVAKDGMIYSPAKESAYCIDRMNSRQSLFSSGWNIRRKDGTKKKRTASTERQ